MLKAYFIILINLYVIVVKIDCKNIETRARISAINDDEHVHIKVVLPKVLRKHKLPYHTTRPHYAKRLPTQTIDIMRPQQYQQHHYEHEDAKNIFSNHNEFEIPPPMAMLTTENEILSHIAATAPLADNDISQSHTIRTQGLNLPAIMLPPKTTKSLYATTPDAYSSTLLDGNVLSADDFLREVQHIYAQKYGSPTLMMAPQMQALTKTTMTTTPTTAVAAPTSVSTSTSTSRKKQRKNQKKRKQTNNNNNYLNKVVQQHEYTFPHYQQGFKPYSSNQEFSNYFNHYDDYTSNNNNYFNGKKTKFSIIDAASGPNELITNTDDIDGNPSSSSSEHNTDSVSDTLMSFNAPIQPEEYQPAYAIESSYNNNNNNADSDIYGYVNESDEDDEVYEDFKPVSYQNLYATYSATPTSNHLSSSTISMPTKLKYKRQEQGQPLREQFVQLSSIAPIVSTGNIDTLRMLQQQQQNRILPTLTTNKREITDEIGKQHRHNQNLHSNSHHRQQQQQQRNPHKSYKNRYNVNRRRLIAT